MTKHRKPHTTKRDKTTARKTPGSPEWWTRQSGEVVTYQAGEPKPDLPPGQPIRRRRKPEPPKILEPGPVSDEQGLANIIKMARLYRKGSGQEG